MVNVVMADGRTKRTESAVSRWLNVSMAWNEKSPEQKLATVIRWFAGVGVFCVFLAVVFGDRVFSPDSVFAYILGDGWERGVNVFAVTASIMYACVAITVATIAQWVLRLLSDVLGTRGETVCRLLSSVVKYGMVVFMLYWCLGVLGVDTATLLASMGIITLALSFGAKDLITDILCGLFIIFEGEFRVGDIIQVGSSTGTVMEIGVRTTKIKNGAGDVLVLRNSGISNVVNKTKLDSYANVDVVIPTGESLPYVENVLSREPAEGGRARARDLGRPVLQGRGRADRFGYDHPRGGDMFGDRSRGARAQLEARDEAAALAQRYRAVPADLRKTTRREPTADELMENAAQLKGGGCIQRATGQRRAQRRERRPQVALPRAAASGKPPRAPEPWRKQGWVSIKPPGRGWMGLPCDSGTI